MIEIKIDEYTCPNDPLAAANKITDVDKFIDGFRKLCDACNMHNITISRFKNCPIPTQLKFDDGTYIGLQRLFKEIGFKYET